MSKNIALKRVRLPSCCIIWTCMYIRTHTPCSSHANATDVQALNKIRCNDSIYKYLASNEHGIQRFKLVSPMRTVSREPLFALNKISGATEETFQARNDWKIYIWDYFSKDFSKLYEFYEIICFYIFLDYLYIFRWMRHCYK